MMETYWNLPKITSSPTAIALASDTLRNYRSDTLTPQYSANIVSPKVSWTRFEAGTSDLFNPRAAPSLRVETEVVTMHGPGDTWPTAGRNESDLRDFLLRTVDLVGIVCVTSMYTRLNLRI